MTMRAYPRYKDSGVAWLGEVPEHWGLQRLKNLATAASSGVDKKIEENERQVQFLATSLVYNSDFFTADMVSDIASASVEEFSKFAITNDDIVLTKDSVVPDRIADVAIAKGEFDDVICGYHLILIRTFSNLQPQFLFYWLKSSVSNQRLLSAARGTTIIGIGAGEVGGLLMPLPPYPEQAAIAAFLDRETAKIDALVAEQRRLIELLTEKRRAVISHAVTKGLNPDAPMKHSGIEWIGEVPEHWEVLRLKNLLQQKITDGPHSTPEFLSEGVPFLSVDGIQDGELVFEGCRYVSSDDHEIFRRKTDPRRDDILMGKAASTGKLARVKVDFEFSVWSPLALIRVHDEKCSSEFVEYALKSEQSQVQIELFCTSNTQKNISMDDIPRIAVVLPPIEEQRQIMQYVGSQLDGIGSLIANANGLMQILAERRAALISAAVTGKIDVRGSVPASPEEVAV